MSPSRCTSRRETVSSCRADARFASPAISPIPAVDPTTTFTGAKDGGVTVYKGGGHFFGMGGEFALTGGQAELLLGVLPPIVHIRKEADKATLHWCIERMRQELRDPQPGGFVVAQQLATLLLVQTLRLHLAEGRGGGVGWLFALAGQADGGGAERDAR